MNISIIYEDDEALVINKPAGLVVHGDGRTNEPTLVDWVRAHYPKIAMEDVGESIHLTEGGEIKKPGIVHRIDRDTSGVLLIAKTHASFENLKAQFQARTIKKTYRAIVHGVFREPQGTINKPIGRSRSDFRKWSAEYGARGELREAVTEYRVLGVGEVDSVRLSYVEVFPRTGRTHQIRVHMKAVGHPLLCDALYAPKHPPALDLERVALHAFSISWRSLGGTEKHAEAPLPEDFRFALAGLGIVC